MQIKHDEQKGTTTITLDWTETRQFISQTYARNTVGEWVKNVVDKFGGGSKYKQKEEK